MNCMHSVLGAKIIPGKDASLNAGAAPIDDGRNWPYQSAEYGCQDLLAYSSYCHGSGDVFLVDMNSMQLVQTLHGHNAPVTCVQWKPPPASYLQHGLFLITGDRGGAVAIWDVAEGVVLNSIQVPNSQPIHAFSYLAKQHLLVVTRDGSNFVYDSHLVGKEPFGEFEFPVRTEPTDSFVPLRVCTSKLSSTQASCFVLGDRLRVIGSLETAPGKGGVALQMKDLVYDSEDGHETVLDATFSEAHEDVLYFATRNSVGVYDWKTGLLLNEQVLWHTKSDVEFRRLFSSSPSSWTEGPQELPFLYSFGTDQRLCAWYNSQKEKVTTVSADVRGARIVSKTVSNVVQSRTTANLFAVIFADGSVARWRYLVERRRWSLEGFFSFALLKPTRLCVVGDNIVCCALENGHMVLLDVMHNVTLRRINIVHSGGTRIILLSPHRWGESVWMVTNKSTQLRNFHQVTLFDCRSGSPLRVLRRPTIPDSTRMKEITLSATGTFLLLTFLDGTFEVWGVEEGDLIYTFEGMGVAGVSWAPQSFLSCLTGVQGSPQLLAIIFTDGGMSLWTVYKDRVVKNRDVTSLLSGGSIPRVNCVPTEEALILTHGVKLPLVVSLGSFGFSLEAFKSVSPNNPAIYVAVSKGEGMCANNTRTEKNNSVVLVAIAFTDGAFGVWNASNKERISYSRSTLINLTAKQLTWIADKLFVLTTNGDIAVLDKSLTSANSNVSCKFHRRPLQTSAFFLPAHRTYIQTFLETQTMCESPGTGNLQSASSPSYLVQSIDSQRRPCRGPFGQVITEGIRTLAQELDLYKETMVPRHIREPMQRAVVQKRTEEVAFWVARFFGQEEKQRFWLQFCVNKYFCHFGSKAKDEIQPSDGVEVERKWASPFFYSHCNRFSEAVANPDVIRSNRMCINEHRIAALEATKSQNTEVSACRLIVARELLKLQEAQRAIDVLMDANLESDQFSHLANLAVMIAASITARESSSFSLFSNTTKRAAALHLARRDLDAAVEKFILSGDYYEAGLALQSCGKWGEAAALAKVTSMTPNQKKEILYRWCSYYAKRGEIMEVARMLFSISSPSEALVLLSESVQLIDVAGLLAIVLLEDSFFSSWESLQKVIPSPLRDEDPSGALSLGDVVLNVLADYCSVLNSVGNVVAERMVLEIIASLKRGNRQASTLSA
ncbi:hypothetical protein TCSYLVIO_003733 [Trypanosoma cruzi]|nr:hypothetical protein TCSYLVIO_003733 [Trypanosoma cruzi]